MPSIRSIIAGSIFLAVLPSALLCAPVMVDYAEAVPFTTEDFESSPAGEFTSPGSFSGFIFSAAAPRIADIDTICRAPGQCLTANDLLLDGIRTFSGFLPGTHLFGVRLGFVNPEQFSTLEITVTGRNATRVFSDFSTTDLTATLAFEDLQGLLGVSFRIASDIEGPNGPFRTNYGFDDVITSKRPVAPVPLPAAGWLLWGAVIALGAAARRRQAF